MSKPATNDETAWAAVQGSRARSLSAARLEVHYAAQFGAAFGISYLRKEADDSHTNLGWDASLGALMSRGASGRNGAVAVGVCVADLTLVVTRDNAVGAVIPLDGVTIAEATEALCAALAAEGLDPDRFSLARHYEIPTHPVATGAAFSADSDALEQLSRWFANASRELNRIATTVPGASEVRLWPHHFDIATLVTIGPNASTGAGMVGGDGYYDEPYFYVNAHPQPRADQLIDSLAGGGTWHTHEWIGAVLPGSRVAGDAAAQQAQVRAYLDAGLAACRALVAK